MRIHLPPLLAAFVLATVNTTPTQAADPLKPLKAGIIGLDTSHVPAFTKLFNNPKADGDLAGITVTAAYPGGTDMPASANRIANFTEQVRAMGVQIVDTIPALTAQVDVILLESVDGRIHLKEAREAFKAGKPVFIDKPLAGNLPESIAIAELAKRHSVACFTSSSSRFGADLRELMGSEEIGDILSATTWGPCSYQTGTPDLFFYAIHGVESLFTLMGPGCATVQRTKTATNDQTVGTWNDGRVGTYHGIVKGKSEFGALVYGSKSVKAGGKTISYEALCRAIGRFFRTGTPPVTLDESLEIMAFMEAADESIRQGGKPVSVPETLQKARLEATKLLQ